MSPLTDVLGYGTTSESERQRLNDYVCSRVFTPGGTYLPEYDQNNQVWYPRTYPSMTRITRFGTRIPTRVLPE